MNSSKMFNWENKIVIVTGGAGGIGSAIVMEFVRSGANVVIADINKSAADLLAKQIGEKGSKTIAIMFDITQSRDIDEMIRKTVSEFRTIDILVNTVGTTFRCPAIDYPEAEFRRVFEVNLMGAFFTSQKVAKIMVKHKKGKIINFSSIGGNLGSHDLAAYCASKASLVGLTKVLGNEWIPHGINVNAVAPGPTNTELEGDWLREDPSRKEKFFSQFPVGHWAEPKDMIGAVMFLASEASNFVVGQTLTVDGGFMYNL